ncbi:hypothetical protein PM3016_7244 [Paenibacillus mucilaginosus 3016]|uniref:Uncharacterized protein n=1 Tax=Paenibacillus mucilaginosus 3016 TaxID=1116391 RepID=H6NBQ1_9BACL|nr:hypothetical protein [Paenibacillus mucilaginosus]AFC33820.1 hypothetical protein PM3016_7244 [Paenibacillus mucilaginosus 3016]WFA22207.1 hypothetical protein ERY13_36065 [Paenibacillus mucilaginosus]
MSMNHLNAWMKSLSHNYVLIAVAAVLFFGAKSLAGYITYRRIRRDLNEIKSLVKERSASGSDAGSRSNITRP